MKAHKLSRLVASLLYIFLVASILIEISLPMLIDTYMIWMKDFFSQAAYYRGFVLAFGMVQVGGSIWILSELLMIFRTIGQDPFVDRNIHAFKRMGWVALGMALLFFIKCIFFLTPMTVMCGFVLLVCGLFSLVLGDVFNQAVYYKQENDLTI